MSPLGLPTVTLPDPATVSLTKTYDVLIVGSGAAGGMAAHALTSHGLDVLLLEAGRQVDFEAEVRSLEWPYDHPRRGKLAPDTYVLNESRLQAAQAALRAVARPLHQRHELAAAR